MFGVLLTYTESGTCEQEEYQTKTPLIVTKQAFAQKGSPPKDGPVCVGKPPLYNRRFPTKP